MLKSCILEILACTTLKSCLIKHKVGAKYNIAVQTYVHNPRRYSVLIEVRAKEPLFNDATILAFT